MSRSATPKVTGIGLALLTTALAAVASAAPTTADDIRDIRPLILIPPWWYWLVAAAAAMVVLALIGFGIRYWRRRSQRALTPLERARQALAQADELARAGQCRPWADLVAQTIRSALAARLASESCPQTTNELATTDWARVPQGTTVDGPALAALLSTCDLTRFALARLDANALRATTDAARDWIERLFAPAPTPAPAPAPAPAPDISPSAHETPSNPASDAA